MSREGQDNFWEDRVEPLNGPVMDGVKYRGRRYWLPEPACRAATDIARYYNLFLPHCGVPSEQRAVRTVLDAPDFGVDVLGFVNQMMDLGLGFLAGSNLVSPVAWAAIGNVGVHGLARLRFDSTEDLITHYIDQILGDDIPCLPTSIFHQEHAIRKIMELAEAMKMPRGFILAASVMFLRDIVVNCGPDTEELSCVFGNSWGEASKQPDHSAWWFARAVLVTQPSRVDINAGRLSTAIVPVREIRPKGREFCRIRVDEDIRPGLAVPAAKVHDFGDIDVTDDYSEYWY